MSFKNFIKNSKEARKVFGKKEIGIVLKQLDGIRLTQSEKNRLSRDIRPKLRFVEECSKFKDEFELKKDSASLRIAEKALGLILNDELKERIEAVLLFGSHVKGTVTKRSDIDICAVFKGGISLTEATKFRIRISKEMPEKADIQVFNVLPQKIKRDIARSHRVLYRAKDFDNVEFTVRHLKDEDYFIRMEHIFHSIEA